MTGKAETESVAGPNEETKTEASTPLCGKKCGDGSVTCVRRSDHDETCFSVQWWCATHEQLRIARDGICVECVTAELKELRKLINGNSEALNLLSGKTSVLESRYDDHIDDLWAAKEKLSKKLNELKGRLRQDERDDVLADSYQFSAGIGTALRLLLQPQIILSGYGAVMAGVMPRTLMQEALDECKREQIAQVRGEYEAARGLLRHVFNLVSTWRSRFDVPF